MSPGEVQYPDVLSRAVCDSGLLAAGDRVLVAVSGGPDSLSLLHALHALREVLGLCSLEVAHLNHGLRGANADSDAAFVAAFCAERALPCHVGVADVGTLARQHKISTQQAARLARYEFLEATARAIGAEHVATAHTQNDQVETVLLNILRGTGLDGLGGIPARRGLFIRPLLQVTRADVLDYCTAHGLTPRLDSSNLHTNHYARNRLRLDLLPQLERDYNPGVRQALLRLSQTAGRDAHYLHTQAQAALADVTITGDASRLVLDCARLRTLHPALLRHVLRAAIQQQRGTLEGVAHAHLEHLYGALSGRKRLPFGLTTPAPHCALRVTQRRFTILPAQLA